jgi:hypothetical protein
VANVLAWALSARALHRQGHTTGAAEWSQRRLQLLLSAGYVAGCAWRSAVPVYDVPRLCLVDSWASSAIVGRSVTVAELCFARRRATHRVAGRRQHAGAAASRAIVLIAG